MRSFRFASVVIALAACALPFRARAAAAGIEPDPAEPEPAAIVLDPLEIVADRTPAADNAEIEARRLAGSEPFTGITREEFGRRSNRRAGDIVSRLPGVFMGGAPGENNDARVAGLDKEFTRTQVDGGLLPDGGEKRELQLNRVPADLIQEVRVLRNTSPEFESDGIGGRIDLRFRTIPKQRLTADVRASAGARSNNNDLRQAHSLTIGGRPFGADEPFGFLLAFNVIDDPTTKEKTTEDFSALGVRTKSNLEQEHKSLEARDVYLDLSWFYPSGEFHLKPIRLETTENKTKIADTFDHTKPAASDQSRSLETERKTKLGAGFTLQNIHRFAGLSGPSLDTRIAYHDVAEDKPGKIKEDYAEAASVLGLKKVTVENEDKTETSLAFDSKLTLPLGPDSAHIVKSGVSLRLRERERFKTKTEASSPAFVPVDKTGPKDNYTLEENYYAVFAQDTWTFAPDWTLLVGARYEYVTLAGRTPAQSEQDASFSDLNPSAQLAWRARPDTTFKFAVSRGVNRPKFDELAPYVDTNSNDKDVIGNPALEPARAWKFDLGVDFSRRDLFLAANVFHKAIEGVIEQVATGGDAEGRPGIPDYQTLNVGDGWVRGLELEQRVGFRWTGVPALSGLGLFANQSFFRSEVTDAAGVSKPFNGQPEFLATVGLDYEIGRFYFNTSARHIGERPGDESSADRKLQSSQLILDAAMHVRLTPRLDVFVEASNLADAGNDETTIKANGTRTVKTESTGRAWFAGARYKF